MAPLRAALLAAGAAAALAHAGQVANHDEVAMLQASVQEVSAKQLEEAQAEPPGGYALAGALQCRGKEAATEKPAPVVDEPLPTGLPPRADGEEDPPGAGTLRAVLELMIVALIFDGMRRWRLQKQDAPKSKRACGDAAQAAEEAAAEAAWIEMVNASAAGNVEAFDKALSRNPSMARADAWGCTPLHFAAAGGSAPIAAKLLQRGAEVDARDASDETPLHLAARHGHGAVCEALLEAGADIDAVSAQDMTPLLIAGHANQEPVCRLLADRGASCAGAADEQLPPLVVSQLVRKVFAA